MQTAPIKSTQFYLTFRLARLVIVGLLVSCQSSQHLAPSTPDIIITEFTTCRGWSETGQLIALTDKISTNAPSISVCGSLKSNRPIGLSVYWSHEGKIVFRDIKQINGNFQSSLVRPSNGFSKGIYDVEIVIGRPIVRAIKFEVID